VRTVSRIEQQRKLNFTLRNAKKKLSGEMEKMRKLGGAALEKLLW